MPLNRTAGLLLALVACGPNAGKVEAQRYVTEIGPTVDRNAALARGHLELAAELRKGALDADGLATKLEQGVLPEAREVVAGARALHPTEPALMAAHQQLVDAWTMRVDAVSDLTRAWHAGDLAGLDAAMATEQKASDAELAGLLAINAALSPYQLALDPYGGSGS